MYHIWTPNLKRNDFFPYQYLSGLSKSQYIAICSSHGHSCASEPMSSRLLSLIVFFPFGDFGFVFSFSFYLYMVFLGLGGGAANTHANEINMSYATKGIFSCNQEVDFLTHNLTIKTIQIVLNILKPQYTKDQVNYMPFEWVLNH